MLLYNNGQSYESQDCPRPPTLFNALPSRATLEKYIPIHFHQSISMGGMVETSNFGGAALKDILKKRSKPWYRDTVLLKLNFLLLCALLTQTASGFDASMLGCSVPPELLCQRY